MKASIRNLLLPVLLGASVVSSPLQAETLRLWSWQGHPGYEKLAAEAMKWFEVGMKLNPLDPYNFAHYGMCLHWVNRHKEAAPYFDQALQRGAQLPFGCRMGSCGMCCARLLEGNVDQSSQIFLTEEQEQKGYVLLCQARPLSDAVVVMCTDDEIDPL